MTIDDKITDEKLYKDYKDRKIYIFEKLLREVFDEIKVLKDEINENGLIYYLNVNTARKRLNSFNNL